MIKDLTRGNPIRLIAAFAVPIMLGSLFQQFYNMADTAIVGRFIGKEAMGAVGATGAISFLIIGFAGGISSGFGIVISRFFGAGDHDQIRRGVAHVITLTAIISLLLSAVSVLTLRGLLSLMGTSEVFFEMSYVYEKIIFLGIPATMLYNVESCLLRALGNSRTPLWFLILSSALNIGFDLLFIVTFRMGVAGAAYATVLSQLISGILCLVYIIFKVPLLHPTRRDFAFNPMLDRMLLVNGLPMALQFSITAVGSVVLQTAINSLSETAVEAVTVSQKISLLLIQLQEPIGIACASYCGQNIGAGRVDRVRKGVRQSALLALIMGVVSSGLAFLLWRPLCHLFVEGSEVGILDGVWHMILYYIIFFPVLSELFVFRNAIQGMGYSLPAMSAGIFELVARSFVAFAFVGTFGYDAVCFASPFAWIMADVLLVPTYFVIVRKLEKTPKPAPRVE